MTAEPFRVGLLGHGTVGSAFAALLGERADAIESAGGAPARAGRRADPLAGNFDEILDSSDAIVELIGGIEPAREYALRALEAGKPLVTANKQLLSQHGDELFAAARAGRAQLRYEAAVAGVVPVVRVMRESFAGAHIEKVHGIVNGTTNYILTEMARTGASYADALARAQELGYAEADPAEDVNGKDAAAKMAILARLAFHASVRLDDVPFEGIEEITPDDIDYAKEFGLVLKLLGVAERRDGGVSVRVFPCFLYGGHPLASVVGPFNAVTLESPAITEVTLSGPGAGGPQTASAVLGDVVSVMTSPGMDLESARSCDSSRRGGRVGLLPAPRGRRQARRAGQDRPDPGRQRGQREERRAEGDGGQRAARDGRTPGRGGTFQAAVGRSRSSSCCAAAAVDPRDRGRVHRVTSATAEAGGR